MDEINSPAGLPTGSSSGALALVLTACAPMVLLSGCAAAPFTAVFDRTVRTDSIRPSWLHDPQLYAMSVTGERRIVFVSEDAKTVCAEPLPDAARAVKAESVLAAPAVLLSQGADGKMEAKTTERFETALTKTHERTELSELVGRLGALACMAYLNRVGAFPATADRAEALRTYDARVNDIIRGALDAAKATAHGARAAKGN